MKSDEEQEPSISINPGESVTLDGKYTTKLTNVGSSIIYIPKPKVPACDCIYGDGACPEHGE